MLGTFKGLRHAINVFCILAKPPPSGVNDRRGSPTIKIGYPSVIEIIVTAAPTGRLARQQKLNLLIIVKDHIRIGYRPRLGIRQVFDNIAI